MTSVSARLSCQPALLTVVLGVIDLLLTTAGVALRDEDWSDLELQLNEHHNRSILRLDTIDALDLTSMTQPDMNVTDAGDIEI